MRVSIDTNPAANHPVSISTISSASVSLHSHLVGRWGAVVVVDNL